MSGWNGEEEDGTNMQREGMLRNYLKFQGTIYLSKDLQEVQKEDRATSSLVKTGETINKKEKKKKYRLIYGTYNKISIIINIIILDVTVLGEP